MRLAKVALLFCAIGAIAADDPKKTDDAETFKGDWKAVSVVTQTGESIPADVAGQFKFNFDGKKYVNKFAEMVEEGGYTIDASKTPKTIDFEIKTGDDKGKKQLGIYKIEDGKLTIIAAVAGSETRPSSFKREAGAQVLEVVLEREKP
jgi:uncharacterized protein (TIGR03067 family)